MSSMIKWLRSKKKDDLVLIAYKLHVENKQLTEAINIGVEEE